MSYEVLLHNGVISI